MRQSSLFRLSVMALPMAMALALGTSHSAVAQPSRQPEAGQSATARSAAAVEVVQRAAQAMGGAEKIAAIRNITATGYGQYAYQWGGGRIDGSPHAPEKYIAANELVRVYDLENNRFQMKERRNMLFPFLAPFGHNFAPQNQILDGSIVYNVAGNEAVRQPSGTQGALWNDGVHVRRMWMMNNPVVLLRRMLTPGTRLSAPRGEGELTVIDGVLSEGDEFSVAFSNDGLPYSLTWAIRHANLGQANLTTYFSGWAAWDGQDGVLMPLGLDTRLDWRDVDYFKMYVDGYQVNTEIEDLAAPTAVRAAPEPPSERPLELSAVKIDDGIWRISNGTTVVEFQDHLVIFELGDNPAVAKQVLAYARSLGSGKPIKYLVPSHHHFDHTDGIRQAVAEGITIIQRPSTLKILKELAEHPAPDFPDDLARNPQPFRSIEMKDHLRLQDETQTLDLYWGLNNGHMADVVFGYVPSAKLIMEGDMVTAAYEWVHWPDTLRDVMEHYELEVEVISPVHAMREISPDLLTLAQAEELLSGGVQRAREHCAEKLADGNYWPGCPIQTKYY